MTGPSNKADYSVLEYYHTFIRLYRGQNAYVTKLAHICYTVMVARYRLLHRHSLTVPLYTVKHQEGNRTMPIAIVITKKSLGGHTWSNTHAVIIGGTQPGPPAGADLQAIGADQPFTSANTGSTPAAFFLHRLLAFERFLHGPDVTFTQLYITDGLRNILNAANTVYASIALPGLVGTNPRTTSGGANTTLEVGGVTLMLHRNPVGFSVKPGRMYLRGALDEASAGVGGPKMIQWQTGGTAQADWTGYVTTALGYGLIQHLHGGTAAATAEYGIPHYQPQRLATASIPKGSLTFVYGCSGISIVGPVLRQVARGRKRTASV
jgi:hypothetical protein